MSRPYFFASLDDTAFVKFFIAEACGLITVSDQRGDLMDNTLEDQGFESRVEVNAC